jgi:hypothetical protein
VILLLVGLLAPIVGSFLWIRQSALRQEGPVVCALMSGAFGIGVSSVVWWRLIQLPLTSRTALIAVDLGICGAVTAGAMLAARWRANRPVRTVPEAIATRSSVSPAPIAIIVPSRLGIIATTIWSFALFASAAAIAIGVFAASCVVVPHGGWDSWAMWNVRARFLYRGFPSGWQDGFAATATEPNYPLLLQSSVARTWTYFGSDSTVVPISLAAIFAVLVVGMAAFSVARARSVAKGLLTAALVVAAPAFIAWSPSQGADIPISAYFLLACILLTSARARPWSMALWASVGLATALSAWTKNEGLAFLCLVSVSIGFCAWRRSTWGDRCRVVGGFALGAAPILLVLWAFKTFVAVPNVMLVSQSVPRALDMLTEQARIVQVLSAFWAEISQGSEGAVGVIPIAGVFALINGVDRHRVSLLGPALFVIGGMVCVDAVVYVLSPHDLSWHIGTSLVRVVMQLTPSAIWAAMWATREPALRASTPRSPPAGEVGFILPLP